MTKTTQTTRTARVSKTVAAKPTKRTAHKTAEAPVKTAKRRVSKNVEIMPWREGSVRAQIVEMISTKKGASLAAICKATGWSELTVRARIGGLKSRGYVVENIGERGAPVYCIS